MSKNNNTNKQLQKSKSNPTNLKKLAKASTQFEFEKVTPLKSVNHEFSNEYLKASNEYETVTNKGLFEIVRHVVKPSEIETFNKCYEYMPLVVRVNFSNGINLPSVLNVNEYIEVNGKKCILINIFVNEFSNKEQLVYRFTKLVACYLDYITFIMNNKDSDYKSFGKMYLNYKRACEIFTRMQGLKVEKSDKHGASIYFDNNVSVEWVEKIFKTNNTIQYFVKATEPKKIKKVKLVWKCDCEKCKDSLPKLTSLTNPKEIPSYPVLTCAHGHKIEVVATEEKEGE